MQPEDDLMRFAPDEPAALAVGSALIGYQPRISLRDDEVVGLEALLR